MDKTHLPKVAHITEAWQGGIATYVEGLIKHQVESGEADVHLVCSRTKTSRLEPAGFSQHFYKSSRKNPFIIIYAIWRIKKIIKKINPDVIHAHSSFAGLYSRAFKLKKIDGTKIPVIYCAHGWSFGQETNWFKKTGYKLIECLMLKNTAAIINLSMHEDIVATNAGIKAPVQKIILSCVREKQSQGTPLNINENKINIGYIGRLDEKKGYDFFAREMSVCKRADIQVHVIGTSVIGKNAIPDNPDFNYIGWVDNSRIDDYIKQLDVVIIPSKWEGFSLLVLEVLRNGKPLIISNRTSLPEAVIHGFNGYIFNLNNPASFHNVLAKLDKNELARIGQNARMVFEQTFSGVKHCIDTMDIYKEVTN